MKASTICVVVGLVILLAGFPAQAKSSCTDPNHVLNNKYGWLNDGGLLAANLHPSNISDFIPLIQVGYLSFDGIGNVSGEHDTNLGGLLIPHTDSGTYSVNLDCTTGTIALDNGFTTSIVITGGGQEIKFVSATEGGVSSGSLRLVGTAACSANTVTGKSYAYATHGFVGKGHAFPKKLGGFQPAANAGQIFFQGDGTISGLDNENFEGKVMSGRPITGTYTVNADCTGSTTMTIAGEDQSWDLVILPDGNQVIFGATTSGIIWAGTLAED
jgi:hypothetical protein